MNTLKKYPRLIIVVLIATLLVSILGAKGAVRVAAALFAIYFAFKAFKCEGVGRIEIVTQLAIPLIAYLLTRNLLVALITSVAVDYLWDGHKSKKLAKQQALS